MSKFRVARLASISISRADETKTGTPIQTNFRKAALFPAAITAVTVRPSTSKKSQLLSAAAEGCIRSPRMAPHNPSGSSAIQHRVSLATPLQIDIFAPESWLTTFARAGTSPLVYRKTECTLCANPSAPPKMVCSSPITRPNVSAAHSNPYLVLLFPW